MEFLGLRRPGQKDSVDDYQGVLVPLSQASRHQSVIAEYQRRRSAEGRADANDVATFGPGQTKVETGSNGEKTKTELGRGSGSESDSESPYTLEGLRAEVHEDVAASGHDTAYDCKYPLLVELEYRKTGRLCCCVG